jgi:serine protease AprX
MKYKNLLIIALTVLTLPIFGQIAQDSYYIQFSDKAGSIYSIDNPEAFLSQRAIERRQRQYIPIVENDIPVNQNYVDGVEATGATLLFATKWLNGLTITTSDPAVLEAIQALPYVIEIQGLDYEPLEQIIKEKTFFKNEIVTIEKPIISLKGTKDFNYGNAYTQINQLNGIPLHDQGYRGQGMVIGILDGGFQETDTHVAFDSLRVNGQILGTKDFVHPGGNVYTESYHGTMVLSTIGSNVPGQMIGTAPKASFWLLRSEYVSTENVIEEYNWVSAAEYADSVGVDVINSSLGYIDFDMPEWDHTYSQMDGNTAICTIGADLAASKGILVVNSAGNSGDNWDFPYVGSPADGNEVFSIGAVDGNGSRASFSSIGPTYDGRIKPDVMAMGSGTAVASYSNSFSYGSGTSFSSPVTAGMSTCLWQANPDVTNLDIKYAIMLSGNRMDNPDNNYGYGIPDFQLARAVLTTLNELRSSEKLAVVMPNPIANTTNFSLLKDTNYIVRIFDALGKSFFEISGDKLIENDVEMVLNNLNSGFYILNIVVGEQSQSIKILKL